MTLRCLGRAKSSAWVRAVLLVAAAGGAAAYGQVQPAFGPAAYVPDTQLPKLETGNSVVRAKLVKDSQLELRDAADSSPIIMARGVPLAGVQPAGIRSEIQFQAQPSGADVRITYLNTSSSPLTLSEMGVGIITAGEDVRWLHHSTVPKLVDASWSKFVGQSFLYPSDLYSPLMVVQGSKYTVSVSFHYPILAYGHDIRVGLANPAGNNALGEGGRGWYIFGSFANRGNEGSWNRMVADHQATLKPGESRSYVMSVRVSRNDAVPEAERHNEWLRTLTPYRDYFQSLYGDVKYVRDGRPILQYAIADTSLISSSNPSGLGTASRADLVGYGNLVRTIKNSYGRWPRVMIWAPTGVYGTESSRPFNWPSIFASRFYASESFLTAFDPNFGFKSLGTAERTFGLWWGNALQVADRWEPPSVEHLNPDIPAHLQFSFREMDAAVRAGATEVGLDTFSPQVTRLDRLVKYYSILKDRYPNVKFISEPLSNDIMHNLLPTFTDAWQEDKKPASVADLMTVRNPMYLADFLNPGHETWMAYRYVAHQKFFGLTPTPEMMIADMQHLASLGYTPCIGYGLDLSKYPEAQDTVTLSLPPDLIPKKHTVASGNGGGGDGGNDLGGGSGGSSGGNSGGDSGDAGSGSGSSSGGESSGAGSGSGAPNAGPPNTGSSGSGASGSGSSGSGSSGSGSSGSGSSGSGSSGSGSSGSGSSGSGSSGSGSSGSGSSGSGSGNGGSGGGSGGSALLGNKPRALASGAAPLRLKVTGKATDTGVKSERAVTVIQNSRQLQSARAERVRNSAKAATVSNGGPTNGASSGGTGAQTFVSSALSNPYVRRVFIGPTLAPDKPDGGVVPAAQTATLKVVKLPDNE